MGVQNRCYGCNHYEGCVPNSAGEIFCGLNSRKEVMNGVIGCSSFSPDNTAGCAYCNFSSHPPGPICSKNLTSISSGGYKDGYCHGFARRDFWSHNEFKDNKKSGCFITEATCNYFNLTDDCFILSSLRQFRDDVLLASDEWAHLVYDYYEIAEELVKHINASVKRDMIYSNLYKDYLTPLSYRTYIREDHETRIDLYKRMIAYIERELSEQQIS